MEQEMYSYKIMFFGFFALLAIIIMITLFGLSKKNTLSQPNSAVNKKQPTPTRTVEGSLKLVMQGTETVVNGRLFVNVVASSHGRDITGYDLLLFYDPAMVGITQIQSALPDFQIVKKDTGEYMTVTGFKNPSAKTQHIFEDTTLITIIAKPKSKGTTLLELLSAKAKETTKFVDISTQTLYPTVNKIAVEIR